MDQTRKLPIFNSLTDLARQQSVRNEHMTGRCIPASVTAVSGQIVTIKFEVKSDFNLPELQFPIFGSEYIRLPVQVGCKGFLVPSDYYMGGISGMGAGTATLSRQGNLSNLVFFPVGNANWTATDPDMLTLYGVSGVQIMDKLGGKSLITVNENGITLSNGSGTATITDSSTSISHGSNSVTANSSGVSIEGTLTINGMAFTAHTHSNGNEGEPTGGVIA